MNFKTVVVGSYQANCYIIFGDNQNAVLIDPGDEHTLIENVLGECPVELIILTHEHFDHVGEANYFSEKFNAPIYAGKRDVKPLAIQNIKVSRELSDGDVFSVGGNTFSVIGTPGHTHGGICLLCGSVLFSGDTLFCRSIGRTDFQGSDMNEMVLSLQKLMALPDETEVFPGHGNATTIGMEKKDNYYIKTLLKGNIL